MIFYDKIIEMEQEALRLRNKGDIESAAKLFEQITIEDPEYEWGRCFCDLAGCLEDLGKFDEVEKNYLKALEYNPEDHIVLGNYSIFLYKCGDLEKAFNVHLELLNLEKLWGYKRNEDGIQEAISRTEELGEKIGMTKEEVNRKIDEIFL